VRPVRKILCHYSDSGQRRAAITGGVAFTVDQVDDLAVDVAVRLSVVERESFDYTIGCTRVICNPAGYSCEANPEFNWDLVS
jgi:hypothetical protein